MYIHYSQIRYRPICGDTVPEIGMTSEPEKVSCPRCLDLLPSSAYTLRQKWIEALRSGKYRQGRGKLRQEDDFCCLGVLCDVVDPYGWTGNMFYEEYDVIPPEHITKAVGIDINQSDALATLNDKYRKTFSEIADYIEENY